MDTQETKVYLAILIGAAVLGVILIYFIINMMRQQRGILALHRSKISAEINTLERERKRVANDLHDELGPVLLSVRYNVNSLEVHEIEDEETIEKTNEILDGMIDRVREISNDLLPEALLRKGLVTALEETTGKYEKNGIAVSLHHEGIPSLSAETAVHLYRIIQEILHNTVKHAQASQLKIELRKQNAMLFVVTEDNGKGFDYDSEKRDYSGLGLRSLLSRSELLNGTMYLDSKTGKGTRYIFEIPV
jgi:signal transduction histidine kinase